MKYIYMVIGEWVRVWLDGHSISAGISSPGPADMGEAYSVTFLRKVTL
jgi:hypothetical protein